MGGVTLAFEAMTAWAAAAPLHENQGGGQEGAVRLKLFKAGQEVTADESGVFGDLATPA